MSYGWDSNMQFTDLNNDGLDDTVYKELDLDGDNLDDDVYGQTDLDGDGYVDGDFVKDI